MWSGWCEVCFCGFDPFSEFYSLGQVNMKSISQSQADLTLSAFSIEKQAVGGAEIAAYKAQKNPGAVAWGRLVGLKGGKARASVLTSEELSGITKSAATAWWKKERSDAQRF